MDKRAPITVKFEIPYFTVSGIQVRYLKIVEKSGYQALPWVRYITQNGDDYRCGVFGLILRWSVHLVPLQFADSTGERQRSYNASVDFIQYSDFIMNFFYSNCVSTLV